jgi:O-antigen/teichoic acid export membrane protein
MGLQLAVTPLVYRHAADPAMPETVARLFRIAWAVALCGATALGLFAAEIIHVLAGPGFADASGAVYLLCLAAPLATFYVYAPGLALAKRTGAIALANTLAAILGVALGLALVPRFGLAGAAASTLCAACTGFAVHVLAGKRHVRVPYPWMRALALLGLSAGAMTLSDSHAAARALAACLVAAAAALLMWPPRSRRVPDHVRA